MKTKEEIIVLLRQKEAELAEELRKMEEFHKAAWEQYGSELCAGEMLDNERKVVKNIERNKKLLDYFNRRSVDDLEIRFFLETIRESDAKAESEIAFWQKQLLYSQENRLFWEEIAKIAGIKVK